MARDYPRSYRVADQIQRELADLIRREVRDPRVDSLVTISSVEVNRDLTLARVYVTRVGGAPDAGAVEALNSAAGFLRGQVGARLRLRRAPTRMMPMADRPVRKPGRAVARSAEI